MYYQVIGHIVYEINRLISRLVFPALLYCIVASYINILPVISFNIDVEYPIVITNSFHGSNAHFGIAINLLQNKNSDPYPRSESSNNSSKAPTGWVLISAPKANSTHPNHASITEPGVVWRCGLGRFPKVRDNDCRILQMDPTGEYDPLTPKLPQKARQDESWLGGTMFVGQSDRFVACASRWINQKYKGVYLMNGMCYWVPVNQIMSDNVDETWPWLPPKFSYRLGALLLKDRQHFNETNGNITRKANDWSVGQFGFSLSISEDNEMIIGAPGVYDWTGTVVQFKDVKGPRTSHKRFNVPQGSSAFSEVFVAEIQTPDKPSTVLTYDDYFGYAVGTGKFFHPSRSQNRTQYAAGAPRSASLSGKVLIFSFRETNKASTAELDYLTQAIEPPKGGHYASYFGSVIAVGDVNDDGFDDLLVGAPLYGTVDANKFHYFKGSDNIDFADHSTNNDAPFDHENVWRMVSGDEGCVFVYTSNGDDFVRSPQQICGDKIPGARFGSSISFLGDINLDGYKDIAVGAPYENDNHGAVYIYHGGDILIFAQKLSPELIDSRIRTFGYSLSNGVDIDGNYYPDLAVGAYESNQVTIFRTIPLVKFSSKIFSTIPKLLSTTEVFNITTCISYSGRRLPHFLGLWIKLSVNQGLHPKRFLTWMTNDDMMKNTSKLTILKLLEFEKTGSCFNFTAFRNGSFDEVVKAVNIEMLYWIDGYDKVEGPTKVLSYEIIKNGSLGNPQLKFNKSQPDFHDFFKNKLPLAITNKFGSNLLSLPIGSICDSDGDPDCLANLTVQGLFRDRNSMIVCSESPMILGSSDILSLELQVWNHREIALLPIIIDISWNSIPRIKRTGVDCEIINRAHKNESVNGNRYRCDIQRAILEGKKESIHMDFDMSGIYAGEGNKFLSFNLIANTSSKLINGAALQTLTLPLQYEMKVLNYSYEYETEFATDATQETLNISQAFEINLAGPTPIYSAQVEIHIPTYIEINGHSHEFALIRNPVVTYDGASSCEAENGYFVQEPTSSSSTVRPTTTPITTTFAIDDILYDTSDEDTNEFHSYSGPSISEDEQIANVFKEKLHRMKRYAMDSTYNIFALDNNLEGSNGVFKIQCEHPGVTCMKVSCNVKHYHESSKSVIEFKFKLNTSVAKILIDEHYDIESIVLESLGILRIVDQHGQAFGNSANLNVTTRLRILEPVGIPAWILIVSISGGLLLLTLITLTLVKCGFFNRQRKKELEFLKANEQADRYVK